MFFGALPMGCAVGADMTFTKQSLPPILRWAGSKRRLLPELIAQIPEKFSRYIEPFSGSACLFFAIRPHTAILGDLNSELIDAYKTLRAHPFLTWRELTGMPNESDFYYKIRDVDPTHYFPSRRQRVSFFSTAIASTEFIEQTERENLTCQWGLAWEQCPIRDTSTDALMPYAMRISWITILKAWFLVLLCYKVDSSI
jgi:D12 class N6 adenine-specific DNA methyltransferase